MRAFFFFSIFSLHIFRLQLHPTGTKTKVAKRKDPNAPKRAMSAFFIWMGENRERLKKPGMGVADVAKAAGVEWRK
uniref:HMG box domain-containing protein n=1 Tax=Panagrolaimus sp. PS1159 TaxID=55785 RepID=A0AC35G0T3_9BILA